MSEGAEWRIDCCSRPSANYCAMLSTVTARSASQAKAILHRLDALQLLEGGCNEATGNQQNKAGNFTSSQFFCCMPQRTPASPRPPVCNSRWVHTMVPRDKNSLAQDPMQQLHFCTVARTKHGVSPHMKRRTQCARKKLAESSRGRKRPCHQAGKAKG